MMEIEATASYNPEIFEEKFKGKTIQDILCVCDNHILFRFTDDSVVSLETSRESIYLRFNEISKRD